MVVFALVAIRSIDREVPGEDNPATGSHDLVLYITPSPNPP